MRFVFRNMNIKIRILGFQKVNELLCTNINIPYTPKNQRFNYIFIYNPLLINAFFDVFSEYQVCNCKTSLVYSIKNQLVI